VRAASPSPSGAKKSLQSELAVWLAANSAAQLPLLPQIQPA
jgi:hypothetical protein